MQKAIDIVTKVLMANGGLSEWDLEYVTLDATDVVRALDKAGLLKKVLDKPSHP